VKQCPTTVCHFKMDAVELSWGGGCGEAATEFEEFEVP
jgi:hypothetical protein